MLGRLFGQDEGSIRGDHFGLGPLCSKHGLAAKAKSIVKSARNAVEIRLAEFNCETPHVASRVGGHPAIPDDVEWPISRDGNPMVFLAQFSCDELSTERYEGLPDEGLLSVFLDTLDDVPEEARVYYYSLSRDMRRRPPPNSSAVEKMAYRPTFHAIVTIPRPDSKEYDDLQLTQVQKESYNELLDELDNWLEPSALQLGGHPPYRLEEEAVPTVDDGNWEFFLAVHDVDELFVSWPDGGCAFIWIPPLDTRFRRGRASLTWQVNEYDDWTEDEWDDDEEDEEI